MPIPATVFLPQPFANNADPAFINSIPNTGGVGPEATWNLGFPPTTMQEEVSGGKPPLGQDFNGILNALSTHVFAQQAGQLYRYAANVSTAIGGYPVGTMLGMADGAGAWLNLNAANTTDPDGGSPSGWFPIFAPGITPVTTTGGTTTLTAEQSRRGIIYIGGALASNAFVNFPDYTSGQRWLIANNTSGSFTLTVKTTSGSGPIIPQGGTNAPTEVYSNGTNLHPTVAPLSIPIDQAPTALTIAQRTNAGYLLAAYFNQNSALENPAVGSIFVQNAAADGYLRKISILNFEAQLILSNISGQVVDAQVPVSAVNQYRSTILNNSALTGAATAVTQASGDNTALLATTAFVQSAILSGPTRSWQDVTISR